MALSWHTPLKELQLKDMIMQKQYLKQLLIIEVCNIASLKRGKLVLQFLNLNPAERIIVYHFQNQGNYQNE